MAVLEQNGDLSMCSEAARTWLTASRHRRLREFVAALDGRLERPVRVCIDGVSVRVVSMAGRDSALGLWIECSDDPIDALSPRLRQVAEFAAAGATATEIADTLELSTHTVRGYLKDVYRRLGVANRVELSARLRA